MTERERMKKCLNPDLVLHNEVVDAIHWRSERGIYQRRIAELEKEVGNYQNGLNEALKEVERLKGCVKHCTDCRLAGMMPPSVFSVPEDDKDKRIAELEKEVGIRRATAECASRKILFQMKRAAKAEKEVERLRQCGDAERQMAKQTQEPKRCGCGACEWEVYSLTPRKKSPCWIYRQPGEETYMEGIWIPTGWHCPYCSDLLQ